MKRLLSFLMIVALILSVIYSSPANTIVSASEGFWQLKEVVIDLAATTESITTSLSQGSASYKREDTGSGDVFACSMSWSAPADKYEAGQEVVIDLAVSIDTYIWNGKEGSFHSGLNFMGGHISVRFDEPGVPYGFAGNSSTSLVDKDKNNVAKVSTSNGKINISSQAITVSASFRAGSLDGDEIGLYVAPSGIGNVCYIYQWAAQPARETTQPADSDTSEKTGKMIRLSGVVVNVNKERMPRQKITIDLYLDAASQSDTSTADHSYDTVTDIEGRFSQDIPLPDNLETAVGLLVRGSLTCMLPGDNRSFYITSISNEAANDEITVSSFITVDPEADKHDGQDIIQVSRIFSYFFLCAGAWSFDSDTGDLDPLKSNVSDLFELAASSYTYRLVWDAQFFGAVLFDEVDPLKASTLRVETQWLAPAGRNTRSHFSGTGSNSATIRLTPDASRFNDYSRFVILHEYGHYFDAITNAGNLRAINTGTVYPDDINHGGYLNSSTADSHMEGFATAFAAIVQRFRREDAPHVVGHYNIGGAGNYVSWRNNGLDEEFAIASLLYQIFLDYTQPVDFWKILRPDRDDFYAYYLAFKTDAANKQSRLTKLEELAKTGGLYKMPFSDGKYNRGEPFKDSNNTGERDEGEFYADLMFDLDSPGGWINEDKPLQTVTGDFELGRSSDAVRTRRTTYQLPNSYVYLDGVLPADLIVRIIPDGEPMTQSLVSVEDNKVYLGLISRSQTGRVEIAVPGGRVVYSGDLASLQNIIKLTTGQNIPLAEASIGPSDMSLYDLWALPQGGGSAGAEQIILPDLSQIRQLNEQAAAEARKTNTEIGLIHLAAREHGRSYPEMPGKPGRNLITTLLLAAAFVCLAAIVILVLVLVRRKNKLKMTSIGSRQGVQHIEHNQPLALSTRYCRYCGAKNEASDSYCQNCGTRLP